MTDYHGVCVGGPWDRRRIMAQVGRLDVPENAPRQRFDALAPASYKRHRYRHVQVTTGVGLWLHEDLTLPQALTRLVQHYQIEGDSP